MTGVLAGKESNPGRVGRSAQPLSDLDLVDRVGHDPPQPAGSVAKRRLDQSRPVAALDVGRVDDGRRDQAERVHEDVAFAAGYQLARAVVAGPPLRSS